jgi:aspartyl-tRNA(Asn)/glutamyl-tRNA(Gln) amidotransferase subunit A
MITVERFRADGSGQLPRDALARRRPVTEGGAYTLLLEPDLAAAGPLRGVPVAVKDLIDVAGVPTQAGSRARRDARPATADAPVIAALHREGAALVGKTATDEFAFGITGENEYAGTPLHPHDHSRVVGGSSSGSALAVAEGSAAAALGTDTGGSVRVPAALCGLVGVKPSYGVVSAAGVFPLSTSLDHVGVLAADLASAREILR